MDKELKQKIETVVERNIRELKIGTEFYFRDYLVKHNLSEKEMLSLSTEIAQHLRAFVMPKQNNAVVGLPFNVPYIRINLENEFKKIPYEFYLYHSLMGLEFKLSSKVFAVKLKFGIFKINDSNEVKKFVECFFEFCKNCKTLHSNKKWERC